MRSLQLRLHRLWDQKDDPTLIPWDPVCRQDLEWWPVPGRLQAGISLAQVNPHLDFWSDASDVGWGAHLLDVTTSGLWSQEEARLSINARELLAVEYGLWHFHLLVANSTVAVFSDNSTALAYLRKQGGTRSPVLNSIAQRILRWPETIELVLTPQFIQGKNNILADSLSRPNQVQGPEWTLKWEVFQFQESNNKWPEMIDLFATSLNHRCSLYFFFFALPRSVSDLYGCASSELERVSGVCLSTLVNDTAGSEEAPIIFWGSHDSHCSILALETRVSGPPGSSGGWSNQSTEVLRSTQPTALSLSSSRDRQAVPSCLETIQRFARSQGFSSRVAEQLGFARRSSSRAVYQSKWLVYRGWCRGAGHSISWPTLPKIADFLLWLHRVRKLSLSAIMGYRFMLSAVFRFKLPEISTSPVLQDLLWSFQVEAPSHSIQPPSWDLNKVLVHL